MNAVTQEMGPCPCGNPTEHREIHPSGKGYVTAIYFHEPCGVVGTKLQKNGHLKGCTCRSCIGRRNRRSGQRTEAKRHRRLGGQGQTPRDELAFSYSINITTEDKVGRQIPVSIRSFVQSKWAKDALRQAEKKLPVGSDSLPALFLDLSRDGTWVIFRVPAKGLR